jgi:hypothetical protein
MSWAVFLLVSAMGGLIYCLISGMSRDTKMQSQVPTAIVFTLSMLCLALGAGMGVR